MKSLRTLFANLKSVALIALLAGLILASAFVATKTLLFTDKSISNSGSPNVNAGSSGPVVNTGLASPAVKAGAGGSTLNSDSSVRSGDPDVTVWVNTNSGVYHCPNSRWYGNTKTGKYMTQQEAQSKGYRPAYGVLCG